jgi:hypothetical protein
MSYHPESIDFHGRNNYNSSKIADNTATLRATDISVITNTN